MITAFEQFAYLKIEFLSLESTEISDEIVNFCPKEIVEGAIFKDKSGQDPSIDSK